MIIAFEGIDKAGKATQSRMLRDALVKKRIMSALIDFPTHNTPTGDAIAAYIRNGASTALSPDSQLHVAPCLAAADLWAAAPRVESALPTPPHCLLPPF